VRVLLGLGSNLGDRKGHLAAAVRELAALDADLVVSSLYETDPVGGPPQGPYLNCVVRLDSDLEPLELLAVARRLEQDAGRVRTVRNGPRTLDVDLLAVDDVEMGTEELTLPHPRMAERGFVLAPLEEVAPDLAPQGWRERLGGKVEVDRSVRRIGNLELS
jgi:2-amino-4-hydroxy-6-hydroxymethyldihydropteridine diphosphokinase